MRIPLREQSTFSLSGDLLPYLQYEHEGESSLVLSNFLLIRSTPLYHKIISYFAGYIKV